MDALSVAANVIAVVDVSVKVITLCSQYSKAVANASADISRLETLVKGLKTTLDHAEALIKAPQGASLSTSQNLQEQLAACHSTLQKLHHKLDVGVARQTKRRLWIRALKWPFSHDEIEAMMSILERCHRRIMDGLLIDQTTLLLDIKSGVDGVPATSEDVSIARQPHFVVPFPRDPDFVPRPAIQTQIHEQLTGKASRQALFGMGGFGKSQIAIEVAYNVHESSPERSVFWIHGASRATLEQSYRSLADNLALPRRHDPKINILALVCDWLQRDDVAPWLLILDNADNLDMFFSQTEEFPIASYLPKRNNGKVLITSRNLDVAERLTGGHKAIISIPAMESDEALLLLQEKLTSSYDTATATDLIRCLDYIPLAVNQAAAYINRRPVVFAQKSAEIREELLGPDHPDTLVSMGNLALIYYNQGRWEEAEELCMQLTETSKTKLGADHTNTLIIMSNLASIYTDQGRWEEAERLEVQVMETRKAKLGANHLGTLNSMSNLASIYSNQGQWEKAERLEEQVMETRTTKLGADHPDTLDSMNNLASIYSDQGRLKEAERLEVQVMEARTAKLGADHPDTLDSMNILASVYSSQGRWEKAERLEEQVMKTRTTKLGATHPSTLNSISNLAVTYSNQGRLEEAERLLVQLIEASKMKLGADHPDTLTSMNNLAFTYWNQGRLEEAQRLEMQVFEASKAKLGADHPDTLTSMHNLAFTLQRHGRLAEALELMESCESNGVMAER
ncbi:hypothetical protein MY11210_008194 [Beauveria gryllotalpidicola]